MAREEPAKYQQIADDLRARIESGEYPPDSRLPSKSELMARYSVSLGTVTAAIDALHRLGLAEAVQGSGTFARKPPDPEPSAYDMLMARVDEICGEVRRLTERVAALERGEA